MRDDIAEQHGRKGRGNEVRECFERLRRYGLDRTGVAVRLRPREDCGERERAEYACERDRPTERERAQGDCGKRECAREHPTAATATDESDECGNRCSQTCAWEQTRGKDKRGGFEESTGHGGERRMQRGWRDDRAREGKGEPLPRESPFPGESRPRDRSHTK